MQVLGGAEMRQRTEASRVRVLEPGFPATFAASTVVGGS